MIVSESPPTTICGSHQKPPAPTGATSSAHAIPHSARPALGPALSLCFPFFVSESVSLGTSVLLCLLGFALFWVFDASLFPVSSIFLSVSAPCPSPSLSLTPFFCISASLCLFLPWLPSLTSGSPSSWFSGSLSSISGSIFGCSECEKLFRSPRDLERHVLVHTGEKPFPCLECGKFFRHECYLKRHRLLHGTERPFPCHICGKGFITLSNLSRHLKLHRGMD